MGKFEKISKKFKFLNIYFLRPAWVYRSTINPAGRETYEAAVKIPHSNSSTTDKPGSDNSGLKQEALIFSILQHKNILRYV